MDTTGGQAPLDNRHLLDLLATGAKAPPHQRSHSHQSFLDGFVMAELLAPLESVDLNSSGQIQDMALLVLHRNGGKVLPVFTDDRAVHLYFGHQSRRMYKFTGRELCQIADRAGIDAIALNPKGPAGYLMTRQEFVPLGEGLSLTGKDLVWIPDGTEILIGRPANLSIDRNDLHWFASALKQAGVTSAWWTWIRVGGGQPRMAVVVSPDSPKVMVDVHRLMQSTEAPTHGYAFPLDGSSVSNSIREAGEVLL